MSGYTDGYAIMAVENLFRSITAFFSTAAAIFLAGWYPGGETIIPADQFFVVYGLLALGVLAGYKPVILMIGGLYYRWKRD